MRKRSIIRFTSALITILAASVIAPSLITPRNTLEQGIDEPNVGATAIPVEALPEIYSEAFVPEQTDADDVSVAGRIDMLPEELTAQAQAWTEPPPFAPFSVAGTEPEGMLASSDIMSGGQIVDSFSFERRIDFAEGDIYSWLEGITTFRGNNFRDTAAYGWASIINAKFGGKWSRSTGSLTAPDGAFWSGHGWTGQPLIVKWPKQTREIMNMHTWAKEREELVEVIYPAMDGFIYFAELETGEATRDRLNIGFTFKGAGAIDPRGYPLLYVGAGYPSSRGAARIFVISLIDGSILYTFGSGDPFAPRAWTAADAAPLVDAETDRLIYPSENGVLYIINLNSEYDPSAGTMRIDPSDPVKWRYRGVRSQTGGKYWLGVESSPAIWQGHLFFADNGGNLICLDLNTLEPVWVQDVLDDTNNSPVLELENGLPYIYISTGFHGDWRAPANSSAAVPIWKIDATTGEIVWRTDYKCLTSTGVSGGVQGTIAIGKNTLRDLIFVSVARTPDRTSGILAALDKETGEIVWEFRANQYGWSSPVCVYAGDGNGYIIHSTSGGYMYLLDGLTGEVMDSVLLGGVIEASPAVYENTVVIGTRAMKIWGIQLT